MSRDGDGSRTDSGSRTDGGVSEEVRPEVADDPAPNRFDRVRRSTAGVLMTGIAIGLQDAFDLPRPQPAFVIKSPGQPGGQEGSIDLHFDPDDPSKTVAIIRPQPDDDS
ncbi:MAG: hypothetical protein ACYCV7_13520 [Acidimicrobiales bacterium]